MQMFIKCVHWSKLFMKILNDSNPLYKNTVLMFIRLLICNWSLRDCLICKNVKRIFIFIFIWVSRCYFLFIICHMYCIMIIIFVVECIVFLYIIILLFLFFLPDSNYLLAFRKVIYQVFNCNIIEHPKHFLHFDSHIQKAKTNTECILAFILFNVSIINELQIKTNGNLCH